MREKGGDTGRPSERGHSCKSEIWRVSGSRHPTVTSVGDVLQTNAGESGIICPVYRLTLIALTLLGHFPHAQASETDLSKALQTLGGVYGSIWIHEAGHALALLSFGATDVQIDVPGKDGWLTGETRAKLPDEGFDPWQSRTIAMAGLLATNMAGETVLQAETLHNSPLAQSILSASLVSNAIHVYTYYTHYVGRNGYRGNDIDAFEASGGSPHMASAILLLYSGWTLQRMSKNGIPLFYVTLNL